MLNLIEAIVVGLPVVVLILAAQQPHVWLTLVATVIVSIVTTRLSIRYKGLFNRKLNGLSDSWEDHVPFLGWGFANGGRFNYQNG